MDYVVFGIGFGATLLVLGLLFRDLGPRVRFRRPSHADGVFHAEELVARVSWSRFCGALGTVLAIAGVLFVILTAICMVLMVSDGTAGGIMLGSLALLCVLMALWTWAYFDRFGSYGILPERDTEPAQPAIGSPAGASANDTPAVDESGPAVHARGADGPSTKTISDDSVMPTVIDGRQSHDAQPHQPIQTPEERMASSASPLDHDSLEADLDTPMRANQRPGRRGESRTEPASASATKGENDTGDQRNSRDEQTSDTSGTQHPSGTESPATDKPDSQNA